MSVSWGIILVIVLLLFNLNYISAIKIIEIESNPKDDCKDCTEWAELYSEIEVNLSEYWIENSKSNVINLSGIGEGYIKIDFGKRFLTNAGDILILKKSGEVIDETPLLKDEENNNKTWQFCNGEWVFEEQTKNSKNNCPEEPLEEEQPLQENLSNNSEQSIESNTGISIETSEQPKEREIIILNPQVIKTDEDKEKISKNYALYGFVAFCILIGVLFIIKNRKHKNEFR